MALQGVSKRTSVMAFSKSISKTLLPLPGVNWISITFMFGGSSTPSGG